MKTIKSIIALSVVCIAGSTYASECYTDRKVDFSTCDVSKIQQTLKYDPNDSALFGGITLYSFEANNTRRMTVIYPTGAPVSKLRVVTDFKFVRNKDSYEETDTSNCTTGGSYRETDSEIITEQLWVGESCSSVVKDFFKLTKGYVVRIYKVK